MNELPDVSVDALRRLARGMLFDRHGAEDVVQEAWLAALRVRPPASRLGAWLTIAVQTLARNRRRDEARRARREHDAARPEAMAEASEGIAHIEVLRRLLDALEKLDEPYRTAVMLRYLEDQPPRTIARRLGLPVNTARTHVRRGLERLRRDLDGERGEERQHCLAALAPLAGSMPWSAIVAGAGHGTGSGSGWTGVVLMQKKLLLAGIALVLLGISFFVLRSSSSDSTSRAGEAMELAALPSTATSRADAAPAPVSVAAATSQRESLATAPPATGSWVVRGHVTLARRKPLPGAELEGRVYAGPKAEGTPALVARFHADDAGDFAWPLEPPSELCTVHVKPVFPEGLVFPTWDVFLPGDPPPERWTVNVLALDCLVHGLVRGPDRQPLAGAQVRERDRMEEQMCTTDADGRYTLRIPSGDERRVRIRAAGFAQRTLTIDAQEPGDVQAPEVVLGPELRLHGRVLDAAGGPIEGAKVEPGYPFFGESTTTEAEGAFELGTVDGDTEYLSVTAEKDGYVPASQRIDKEQRSAPIELRLQRGVRVTGRVLDPAGAPVWGAWVSVGYTPWSEERLQTYSDREGAFVLEHVPSGAQRFWSWRTGLAELALDVTIPADVAEHAVELTLPKSHFVGGVVLDELGKPLPWTMVYASDAEPWHSPERIEGFQVHSGADGRFRIEGLPEITITLGAVGSGHARVEQKVAELDRDDNVLRMPRSAGLAGTVVDAVSGAPIRSFTVRIGFPGPAYKDKEIDGYPAAWSRGVAIDDADGRWHLSDDFETDRFVAVTIGADGYASATFDGIASALDPDPSAFVARLVAGTLVRGRVVEKASGAPVAGARVRRVTALVPYESLAHSEEKVPEAWTDAGGRFELRDVPTGPMSLVVEHADWSLASDGPFDVGVAPVERWIELSKGATIHGRLLDGRGTALPGETVSVYCLEGTERSIEHSATTDAQGSFTLTGLSAGEYHARWERELGERELYDLVQYLTLAADETKELELRPRGHATINGTLDYDGEIPAVVQVFVMLQGKPHADGSFGKWAESARACFAENGRFSISDLEPGKYTLGVSFGGGENLVHGSAQPEVPESGTIDVRIALERRK